MHCVKYMVNFNREGKRMTFADKLREARKLRKLSQDELAKLTGVSRRSVIAWENAEVVPRARTMKEIAEALQVSLDYLKHDEITDPLHGAATKDYIDEARERYGEATTLVAKGSFKFVLLDEDDRPRALGQVAL